MPRSPRLTLRPARALARCLPSCSASSPERRSAPWLTWRPARGVSCCRSRSCTRSWPGRVRGRRIDASAREQWRSAVKPRHREGRRGKVRRSQAPSRYGVRRPPPRPARNRGSCTLRTRLLRPLFWRSPRRSFATRKTRAPPPRRRRSQAREGRAGLQDADIGFATRHDDVLVFQARNVIGNLLLLGQIEEILFENFRILPQVLGDLLGQGALLIDRPLQGCDHRNSEIAEQAGEVLDIGLELGPQARVDLR